MLTYNFEFLKCLRRNFTTNFKQNYSLSSMAKYQKFISLSFPSSFQSHVSDDYPRNEDLVIFVADHVISHDKSGHVSLHIRSYFIITAIPRCTYVISHGESSHTLWQIQTCYISGSVRSYFVKKRRFATNPSTTRNVNILNVSFQTCTVILKNLENNGKNKAIFIG